MSENQPPQPEQPEAQPSQPEEETPEQELPEAAPTDFRRNIYLLVIILGVVVLAWVVSLIYRPPAPPGAAEPPVPAQQSSPGAASPASAKPTAPPTPMAEPVTPIRIFGSDRVLVAAVPAHLAKRGEKTYRVPELTFDVTNTAPGFDSRSLARLSWAGQRAVVNGIGKLEDIFQPAATVESLKADDRIVAVTVGKETHGYPLDLLNSLAGVLDTVGGRRVFVTCSPLTQVCRCLVAQVDGKPVDWQDTGLVYRGDEVLFDTGTGSLWDSLTGQALTGPMAGKTAELLPAQIWPWGQWTDAHPRANVLVLPGAKIDEKALERVEAYLKDPAVPIAMPTSPASSLLPPKTFVLGLVAGKEARAYDLGALFSAGKTDVKDTVGGQDFEVKVTSARTAVAQSGGKPVDAPVMLYFGWEDSHPHTTVYGHAAPPEKPVSTPKPAPTAQPTPAPQPAPVPAPPLK